MLLASTITIHNFFQLAISGICLGSVYAMIGVAFALIIGVTGRFHFALSTTSSLSALVAAVLTTSVGMPFWASAVVALLVAAISGVAIEAVIYRPMVQRAGTAAFLSVFVASLGITIIGENLMQVYLAGGSGSRSIGGFNSSAIHLFSGSSELAISRVGILSIAVALVLIGAVAVILKYSTLGKILRAVQVNPDLATVMGFEVSGLYLLVFAVGSVLAAAAVISASLTSSATPTVGDADLIFAFVVSFAAGMTSPPVRIAIIGVGLGLLQDLSALFISAIWTDLLVFSVLLIVICFRAFGPTRSVIVAGMEGNLL